METSNRFIIGIDPDVEKSGVAMLDVKQKMFAKVQAMTITELIAYLDCRHGSIIGNPEFYQYTIVIEDSDSTTNWHLNGRVNARAAAAIGHGVGMCHATQRIIKEIAESHGCFEVVQQRPLKKCWMGRDGKITQEEISQFIQGLPKKMNQECRDACLLAWNYANLPIHIPASFYTRRNK